MLEVSFFEDKFLLLDIIVISCYNKFNVVYYWRNKMVIKYELIKKDENSMARVGKITTPHSIIDTPCFMPVGTQATIKAL